MSDAVTHSLIWYLEDSPLLGSAASRVFDACGQGKIAIYVPTICLVEIVYLQEKGCISTNLREQFEVELQAGSINLILANLTIDVVSVLPSIPRSVVPDMLDRIIAATVN